MIQYRHFNENGEIPIEELTSKVPEIHTVPTREQHELRTELAKQLDIEMEKARKSGVIAYS